MESCIVSCPFSVNKAPSRANNLACSLFCDMDICWYSIHQLHRHVLNLPSASCPETNIFYDDPGTTSLSANQMLLRHHYEPPAESAKNANSKKKTHTHTPTHRQLPFSPMKRTGEEDK